MAPETPSPGLRQRKNRRTQLAIVRATADLTIEEGYASATIARIAERADVAPRTVSTWFPAKEDILFGGVADHVDLATKHLSEGSGDVVDRIEAWFAQERSRPPRDPEIARLRFDAIAHDPELRARDHQDYEAIADAVAGAVADQIRASPRDPGPQMFAAATVKLLQLLRSLSFSTEPHEIPPQRDTGIRVLRATLDAIVRGADSPPGK